MNIATGLIYRYSTRYFTNSKYQPRNNNIKIIIHFHWHVFPAEQLVLFVVNIISRKSLKSLIKATGTNRLDLHPVRKIYRLSLLSAHVRHEGGVARSLFVWAPLGIPWVERWNFPLESYPLFAGRPNEDVHVPCAQRILITRRLCI